MKIFCCFIISCISIFCSLTANAAVITDVRKFDSIIKDGEHINWIYDLANYGFVDGRDTIVGQPTLVFEFRDPEDSPQRNWEDRPFISLYIDQARLHTRVYTDDFVIDDGAVFFNEQNVMSIYALVSNDDVWLGDVILSFEFFPGPIRIPEPAPLMLIGIGLISIGLRQRYKQWRRDFIRIKRVVHKRNGKFFI